jgi:hypothetical protein
MEGVGGVRVRTSLTRLEASACASLGGKELLI